MTLKPCRAVRDVTVSCATADTHPEASSREAGASAELAAYNKVVKYAVVTLITMYSSDCGGVPQTNLQFAFLFVILNHQGFSRV